ncbi:DUF998 domain-containing protein [Brucepastera parasyntrophica]|uniref:DUF998 domain-containing protein n=1 Tax=Brucepastera parasyntrophica TaxID=2880008 RepID=UPI00210BA87F|nr:DUF998 domain-containing protein [Brucepastera parasyntrophica]ULQ59948.1 DUF998 domain-containing protein [Brucepastera parasyntrophica]
MADSRKTIFRTISLFGVLAVISYFLHIFLGRFFYDGYNPLAQAVSDLTADNSPSKKIAVIFSAIYGFCATIFSAGFCIYFRKK